MTIRTRTDHPAGHRADRAGHRRGARRRATSARRVPRFDDRGSETVSLAVLVPVALVLIVLIVQAGLLWHARNVLAASAQAGADSGRVLDGTAEQARGAALDFLRRTAGESLTAPAASADRSLERVTVRVSGTAPTVMPIPGLDLRITVGAAAAVERFTTPGQQP